MIKEIQEKIHEYYLESEKNGLTINNTRSRGEYPNALLITKEQYKEALKEIFKLQEEVNDDLLMEIKILSIEGLRVVFVTHIEEPKVIRMREIKNPSVEGLIS